MAGCNVSNEPHPSFLKLQPDETGVDFINAIGEVSYNQFMESPYIYNGAGLAAGDFNNDGLTDLFFAGNLVSSRLYLNKGNFQFEDITENAGVATEQWITGVALIDINSDERLDIYLSVAGEPGTPADERANLLFINNGDLTFTEKASDFGIDDKGYGTQAVFLDYNKSGYPDLFLMNNSPISFSRKGSTVFSVPDDPDGYDKLYRNNGDGTFTDVSAEAGILQQTGFGLGVVALDANRDGWPDLYISNDNIPNDVFYINNGDGTFTDRLDEYMMHTSFSGMGVDAADFTNNGWPDIAQTDMMPEPLVEQRKMSGGNTYDRFQNQRAFGFHYYYPKNSLQMNHGTDESGTVQFSDVSRMAGIAYTDWTWSVLFADLNNSGYRDIVISNGYPKDVINHQYLMTIDSEVRASAEAESERRETLFQGLRNIHIPNYLYRNSVGIQFEDVSYDWGFREPEYSYGMAYADLNNDGKLDLVMNNIDSPASIYQNVMEEADSAGFIQIELKGELPNSQALGAEVTLYQDQTQQYHYHTLYRGFKSTVDGRVHFGLGDFASVDSLIVTWPDGRVSKRINPEINQILTIQQSESSTAEPGTASDSLAEMKLFSEPEETGLQYQHEEKRISDYIIQPTLPAVQSAVGPVFAVGDVTGNGLDDLFIGGVSGEPAKLFLQKNDGTFTHSEFTNTWETDAMFEDTAALFFDFNGDGLNDLYVGSGGYHNYSNIGLLQDRLYINIGNGRFVRDRQALPVMQNNTSCVVKGDLTGDGTEELFVCGGVSPGNYPYSSESYLLQNRNGRFRNVMDESIPDFDESGILTSAAISDFTGNGENDLVTAGLWEPIRLFEQEGGTLTERTIEAELDETKGWWYSISAADLDGNGLPDIVAGNLGLNHTFRTSPDAPLRVLASDFDNTGRTDIIFAVNESGRHYPVFGPFRLGQSITTYFDRISEPERAAEAAADEIFTDEKLRNAYILEADTFESSIFFNSGNGTFKRTPLPEMAQISAVTAIIADDLDADSCSDILLAGNIFRTDPDIPRMDAGKGLFMRGNCEGNFVPESFRQSGFLAPMDVKSMEIIRGSDQTFIAVGNNGGPLQVFQINP
jgi:hypothetical protein